MVSCGPLTSLFREHRLTLLDPIPSGMLRRCLWAWVDDSPDEVSMLFFPFVLALLPADWDLR